MQVAWGLGVGCCLSCLFNGQIVVHESQFLSNGAAFELVETQKPVLYILFCGLEGHVGPLGGCTPGFGSRLSHLTIGSLNSG